MARLLGIDLGTTGVRAGVFDEQGSLVVEASEACPPSPLVAGRAEADAEGWWTAVRDVCTRLAARESLDRVDAVAVTGQAPTAVLVDGAGRPLRPAFCATSWDWS